jgi:glycosyltransferase involved in cell wall biosynthesis
MKYTTTVSNIFLFCSLFFILPLKSNIEEKLTFIIPATGRLTLKRTLESLINQTDGNWLALVGFDGVSSLRPLLDRRIQYFNFRKIGGGFNYGGQVRNALIDKSQTDWVAFVDDDDTLRENFVRVFFTERHKNPIANCIVFRMSYDLQDRHVLPPIGIQRPIENLVGISFAVRAQFLKRHRLQFKNSAIEDFLLLNNIFERNGSMVFSNYIGYNVRF